MNVTVRVRADLARTLARNFPEWDRREKVASAAGLPDAQLAGDAEGSWRCIVDQAVDEGRLPQLLAAAARSKPDAADLRALSERAARGELGEVRKGPSQLPVLAIGAVTVVLGVAVLALGARALVSPTREATIASPPPAPPPAAAAPAPKPPPRPKAREDAPELPAVPPGATIVVTPVAPEAPPHEEAGTDGLADAAASGAGAPSEPAPAPASGAVVKLSSGPCAGAAIRDGRIGYAYAGAQVPVVSDGTWRVADSVNVRADYPDEHNGFDARASVVCAAPRGGLVELAGDPIAVPGGAYWVPVADVRGP